MPEPHFLKAHAKLNLFLHATGKRDDGYHDLQSLVVFLDLADQISFTPMQEQTPEVIITGRFGAPIAQLKSADNLAMRAAKKISDYAGNKIDFNIHVEKNIPPSAGLGGGSADAAAVIRTLLKYWDISIERADLQRILLSLGADLPVCFEQKTTFVEGTGDLLKKGPALPDLPLILVYPNVGSETEAVYKHLKIDREVSLLAATPLLTLEDAVKYLQHTGNDLTDSAIQKCPEIDLALNSIKGQNGILLSRRSGSGSACFGIFDTHENAASAAEIITFDHPHWWCRSVSLIS